MDKEALINAFFNFDKDKDGYISCEDLMIAMMTKGAKMSAEEVPLTIHTHVLTY